MISVHSYCLACGCSWAFGAWIVPLSYQHPIVPSIRDVRYSLRLSRRSV